MLNPKPILLGIGLFVGLSLLSRNSWSIPESGLKYGQVFQDTENEYRLPNGLLSRTAYQESHFRTDIITGETKGSSGEIGIMQIRPEFHPNVNPYDPFDSIRYAGKYLDSLFDRFGNWSSALIAYNWGPTNVDNYGAENAPTSSLNYARGILSDIGVL